MFISNDEQHEVARASTDLHNDIRQSIALAPVTDLVQRGGFSKHWASTVTLVNCSFAVTVDV